MKEASKAHMQALYRVKYCVSTPNCAVVFLKPEGVWDGDPNYKFEVGGKSDVNYVMDTMTYCSITGYLVFLHKVPIMQKSGQQKIITLSTALLASG
jgi:hypothetical protein